MRALTAPGGAASPCTCITLQPAKLQRSQAFFDHIDLGSDEEMDGGEE